MSTEDWFDNHRSQPLASWPDERTVYRAGWWWGFSAGIIVGCFSGGLLVFLLMTIARALDCPQC